MLQQILSFQQHQAMIRFEKFHCVIYQCAWIRIKIVQQRCLIHWLTQTILMQFWLTYHENYFSPKMSYISNDFNQWNEIQNLARWKHDKMHPQHSPEIKNGRHALFTEKNDGEWIDKNIDLLTSIWHGNNHLWHMGPSYI